MSALTKGINLPSMRGSNLAKTLIVCLVVVGLFLIPEIIEFQRSMSGTRSALPAREKIEKEVHEVAVPPVERAEETSPLDAVSALINSAPTQPLTPAEPLVPNVPAVGEGGAQVDPNLLAKCVASLTEPAEKKVQRGLSETPLTWEKIQNPESVGVLRKAQGQALELSRMLAPKKSETRYALITYINAINAVLATPDQFATAEEAIGYVETVDQAVTKALFKEGADRADYLRWQEVSLGDTLKTSRVARTKAQYRMPFNPRVTMEYVGVRQLEKDQNTPAYLDFRGYMIGKDISRVELFWKGQWVAELSLSDPDMNTNRRYFSYMLADARGVYTIVVHDQTGEKFRKSYEFFPRVVRYARDPGGYYVVPYNAMEIGQDNPRLDRMFRASEGGGAAGSSNAAFSRF